MFPSARILDPITHDLVAPAGTIIPPPVIPCPGCGAAPVIMESTPAAHAACACACSGAISVGLVHPPAPPAPPIPLPIAMGSANVFIHGMPALRWTPGPDIGGCGVMLGDMKLTPTRTVFIGDTTKHLPELSKLNETGWCILKKMLDPHADTSYVESSWLRDVLDGKLSWDQAIVDLRDDYRFKHKVPAPTSTTMPYEEMAKWVNGKIPEITKPIEMLKLANPDIRDSDGSLATRDLRRFVHEKSMRRGSIYSCSGISAAVSAHFLESDPLSNPIVWQDLLGQWHYSGRSPGG